MSESEPLLVKLVDDDVEKDDLTTDTKSIRDAIISSHGCTTTNTSEECTKLRKAAIIFRNAYSIKSSVRIVVNNVTANPMELIAYHIPNSRKVSSIAIIYPHNKGGYYITSNLPYIEGCLIFLNGKKIVALYYRGDPKYGNMCSMNIKNVTSSKRTGKISAEKYFKQLSSMRLLGKTGFITTANDGKYYATCNTSKGTDFGYSAAVCDLSVDTKAPTHYYYPYKVTGRNKRHTKSKSYHV